MSLLREIRNGQQTAQQSCSPLVSCITTVAHRALFLFYRFLSCPQGWKLFQGSIYRFVSDEQTNWRRARRNCFVEELESDLAVITSQEEMDFVFSLWNNVPTRLVWLGATRVGESDAFCWVNNEPFNYTYWIGGEPNNLDDREDCMRSGHKLYVNGGEGSFRQRSKSRHCQK